MANITASTALRDFIANRLSSTGGCYYFATLHNAASGGNNITPATTYATTGLGELATANGYTAGGKTLGTMTATAGVLDSPDVVWTATGGSLVADMCAIWVSTTAGVGTVGASLVSLVNSAQTATVGQTMTAGITNPITIPTPA